MNTTKIFLIAIIAIVIAACSASKKSSKSTASTMPSSTTPPVVAKSTNGIYEPGDAELTAIQVQFKDVTLNQLKEGYDLYTKGSCTNCHGAKNIYKRPVTEWKEIMDDMAPKAMLNDSQKDAVYKYVLAIKATQSK